MTVILSISATNLNYIINFETIVFLFGFTVVEKLLTFNFIGIPVFFKVFAHRHHPRPNQWGRARSAGADTDRTGTVADGYCSECDCIGREYCIGRVLYLS